MMCLSNTGLKKEHVKKTKNCSKREVNKRQFTSLWESLEQTSAFYSLQATSACSVDGGQVWDSGAVGGGLVMEALHNSPHFSCGSLRKLIAHPWSRRLTDPTVLQVEVSIPLWIKQKWVDILNYIPGFLFLLLDQADQIGLEDQLHPKKEYTILRVVENSTARNLIWNLSFIAPPECNHSRVLLLSGFNVAYQTECRWTDSAIWQTSAKVLFHFQHLIGV